MRPAFLFGQPCRACAVPRATATANALDLARSRSTSPRIPSCRQWLSYSRFSRQKQQQQQQSRFTAGGPRVLIFRATAGSAAAAAGLGTAAFVELSERDTANGDETSEERMLDASREELRRRRMGNADHDHGGRRWTPWVVVRRTIGFLDLYLLEPVLTAVRFFRLLVIFVPVVAAVPAIWYGHRDPERDNERRGTLWWYQRLVEAMERAGPTFIKLGQWAASRSDIFPNEMCEIMSKLHSHAPAHTLRYTESVLTSAFGLDMADIFEEFDPKPLGVGAIAQVYRARLKPGLAAALDADVADSNSSSSSSSSSSPSPSPSLAHGVVRNVDTVLKSSPKRVTPSPSESYVAVKVIHPGAERTVRRDLRIMSFFATLLNAIPEMEWLSLPNEVAQFGQMMRLQLDLRIEAANLIRFRKNFRHRSTAWFPFPYTQLTSRNVLVEEFAQGIPLKDFIDCGGGVFQQDIGGEGLDSFLRMLLLDNFVHADLHPGNIMVRFYPSSTPVMPLYNMLHRKKKPTDHRAAADHNIESADVTEQVLSRLRPLRNRRNPAAWLAELEAIDAEGFRPQLIFIDTGLVTELSASNRNNFLELFRAIAEFDGYRAGIAMCDRCRQPDAVIDKEGFARKMQSLIDDVKKRTLALGNIKIGDLLQDAMAMVRAHHVRLEGDFINVVISMLVLEGIGRSLNPNADLLNASLPILRQLSARDGAQMARQGDLSLLVLWAGLETRRFLHATVEDVERCVNYDLLSPNV